MLRSSLEEEGSDGASRFANGVLNSISVQEKPPRALMIAMTANAAGALRSDEVAKDHFERALWQQMQDSLEEQ